MDTLGQIAAGPEAAGPSLRRRLVIGAAALAAGAGLYFAAEASPFEIVAPIFQPETAQAAAPSEEPTYFGVFRRRGGASRARSASSQLALTARPGGLRGILSSPAWKPGDEGDGRLLTLADAPAALSDAAADELQSALEVQIAGVPAPEASMLDSASTSRAGFSASGSGFGGGGRSQPTSAFPSGGMPSDGGDDSGGGASGPPSAPGGASSIDPSDLTSDLPPAAASPDAAAGPVPEPGSWVLMITGFAIVGAALRRRSALLQTR